MKAVTRLFFKIAPDCARIITTATIEFGKENTYEFRNPYYSIYIGQFVCQILKYETIENLVNFELKSGLIG